MSKLHNLVRLGINDFKKGSFYFKFKRVIEIPVSDKPAPYKRNYFDK